MTSASLSLALDRVSARLGNRTVLEEVSATLGAGEILGVIGPNGAGKSTLLRVAAGLLQPSAGSVTLDGSSLAKWDRRRLGRRIAFLPQERTVHWPLSVRGVVSLGRLPHRAFAAAESREDADAISRAISQADIVALEHRTVSELSGGERARVLLARALAQDTHILVADEPAAGLDPAHQLDLFERFRAMAEQGRSVIVALHDLGTAARYCHRLLLLSNGRAIALAKPREVLTAGMLASAYGIAAFVGETDGVPIVTPLRRLT